MQAKKRKNQRTELDRAGNEEIEKSSFDSGWLSE